MPFITTKFQEVSLELRWQTVLSSILNFGQISKFKKGHYSPPKIESEFPVDVHIYTLSPSLLQISRNSVEQVSVEVRWQTFSSIFHFGLISKFKKGEIRENNNWNKIWVLSFILAKFRSSRRIFKIY